MSRICTLFSLLLVGFVAPQLAAQTTIPATFDVLFDDFESGRFDLWHLAPGSTPALTGAAARNGSLGLAIAIDPSEDHLVQGGGKPVARAEEGYLSFWFDPNSVSIPDAAWIPGGCLRVGAIRGPDFDVLVAVRVCNPAGLGYKAFIEYTNGAGVLQFDDSAGMFNLVDGWQRITIGFRVDEWAAAWVNGTSKRALTGISHVEPYGSVVEVGKTNVNTTTTPSGTVYFDDVAFHLPRYSDLWVSAATGNDANDGLTPGTALATIGRASDLAGAGTTVHILSGVYRESIRPAQGGAASEPSVYKAENGAGTVKVRGSVESASLVWTQMSSNTIGLPASVSPTSVWWADLTSFGLTGRPRFVVRLDGSGAVVARPPVAREPDWSIVTYWKQHEFWWAADGGSAPAGCDPSTNPNCDAATRHSTQLTDQTNDAAPAGVESGNLKTLGSLVGATLVALDAIGGHYHYRRKIVAHSVASGRITVDSPCQVGGSPGLGWGTKYHLESHPALLDTPGEWWFDDSTDRLYLWPPSAGNPASQNLEISVRDVGLDLQNRSYVQIDGLVFEFFNAEAVSNWNYISHRSIDNELRNCTLRFVNLGVDVTQVIEAGSYPDAGIDGFTLRDCEIAHVDTEALRVNDFWDNGTEPDSFDRAGIRDTLVTGCSIHDIGLHNDGLLGDSPAGIAIQHPTRFLFVNNHVADISHNGLQVSRSTIQSSKTWGFLPSEIVTGEILFEGNIFERSCLLKSDCGGLKFWGEPPDTHVFRDVLVFRNTFRDTFGWSWTAQQRGVWSAGSQAGLGGFGLYLDTSSGVHAYRNEFHDHGYAGIYAGKNWRDGDITIVNNVISDSLFGMRFAGLPWDTHDPVRLEVINNIVANIEGYAVFLDDADGVFSQVTIDHDLYPWAGWGTSLFKPGIMSIMKSSSSSYLQTLAEVRAATPFEDSGEVGDPLFVSYNPSDHDLFDSSAPDFRLQPGSPAVDLGSASLPTSLVALLSLFAVDDDTKQGAAWDAGRYEGTAAPALDISDEAVTEGDTGQKTMSFTVTVSPAATSEVSVDYSTSNGSAQAGSDYSAASGNLTIPAGNPTGVIEVSVFGDALTESDETFFVTLSSPVNAQVADDTANGVIVSDDCGNLTVTDQTVNGTSRIGTCGTIWAAPNVVVENGGELTLSAGVRLVLRSGFRVKTGGRFVGEAGRATMP
jgi:hypothetical protein